MKSIIKSILVSHLIKLLDGHRDNDVVVDFDDYYLPITGTKYDPIGDFIVIKLSAGDVLATKETIIEKGTIRKKRPSETKKVKNDG